MARKKYGDAFGMPNQESSKAIEPEKTSEEGNDTMTAEAVNTGAETKPEATPESSQGQQPISNLSSGLIDIYQQRSKKKKLDESHTRATFLVENELLEKLNKVCQNQRGYKTILINEALRHILQEFEDSGFIENDENGNN